MRFGHERSEGPNGMTIERFTNIFSTWFRREIFCSVCFNLFLTILLQPQSCHQLNSIDWQFLLKLNPEFSVIVIRRVCPLVIVPVLFENTFQRSIRFSIYLFCHQKECVITAYKIWISVGMNDVNNNVDQSKDIFSCFQADQYILNNFIKHYRASRVLGKNQTNQVCRYDDQGRVYQHCKFHDPWGRGSCARAWLYKSYNETALFL